MLACTLPLGACSLTDILLGTKTDYTVTRNSADRESSDYLEQVLEERIKEKVKTLADDQDTRARQEENIEETTRQDLLKALQAKGYYNATVTFVKEGQSLSGRYDVDYGDPFRISSVRATPERYDRYLNKNKLAAGMVLDAETVLAVQSRLARRIQKGRCYVSMDVRNEVYLDRANHTARVNFPVTAGQEGVFGPLTYTGNATVKEYFLRSLLPWSEGECFNREKIETYKTALLQSGLFSKAEINIADPPQENGAVPIKVDVRERAQRSVSAGLTYYSDEGPGALLGWEHRNMFGGAEKVTADISVSALKQSLDAGFEKPYFLTKDQSLSLTSSMHRQNTDAYDELGLSAGGAINKNFSKHLSASTGVDFSVTRIDDTVTDSSNTFGLLSLPQAAMFDTRNNKLDPTKGWNLSAEARPYFDVLGESNPFFKFRFDGSGYVALADRKKLVLAGKAGIGSIWGADLDGVPATERFYAGGGGTVRGFDYQNVGPQKDGNPTGGLSIASASLELRSKFTPTLGAVIFVDGASVSESSTPDLDNLAIGSGVGLRYYTGFGPIRFDIATPLTQKDNVDQNYQFYISIGQAF